MPTEIPGKKILPLLLLAIDDSNTEVREGALLLLSRLTQDPAVLAVLQQVNPAPDCTFIELDWQTMLREMEIP